MKVTLIWWNTEKEVFWMTVGSFSFWPSNPAAADGDHEFLLRQLKKNEITVQVRTMVNNSRTSKIEFC